MPAITTNILIIQPEAADEAVCEKRTVELPDDDMASRGPSKFYEALKAIILPILREARPDAGLERVRVLYRGQYRDMFVDDQGVRFGLPVNLVATAIYRNNWMVQHPNDRPDWLPEVYGIAILFPDHPVWS